MSSITVEPTSAVTLVTVCPHCGKPDHQAMRATEPTQDERFRMMGVVAFPDAVARTCEGCKENYIVTFAEPMPLNSSRSGRITHEKPSWMTDREWERVRLVADSVNRASYDEAGTNAIRFLLDVIDSAAGVSKTFHERHELDTRRARIYNAALTQIEGALKIPAAEYVPAIGDVFTIIDKARGDAARTPLPVTLDPEAVASGAIIPPDGARADGTGQHGDEPGRDDGSSSHE